MNKESRWLCRPADASTPAAQSRRGASVAAFLVTCVLTSGAVAAEPGFRFSKPVQSPALAQEELLSVTLDADIYDATGDDLRDLRLIDKSGDPTPSVLRPVKTSRSQTVRRTWTAERPAARPLENGGLEIIVELKPNDPAANGLTLVTPLDDFEQRVRVETSTDGRAWEPAAESVIFDYSRYMDVRQNRLVFPKTARRHFRIIVDDVTATQESELLELTRRLQGTEETERVERLTVQRRPFRIDRVQFWRDEEQERTTGDAKGDYPPARFHVEQDAAARQTHVFVETRREPVTKLTIETDQRNFSRRASVQVEHIEGVQRTWQSLGEATLTRIDFQDLQREQLSIGFPETRRGRFRIVIENRDSPPLDVTGIAAEGNVQELVFLAAPGETYRVIYGHAGAEPADYDTAAVDELLRSGYAPTPAELGDQQVHADADGPVARNWPALLNDPALLVGVITVLVILLALGLYQAARRVEETSSAPPDEPGA